MKRPISPLSRNPSSAQATTTTSAISWLNDPLVRTVILLLVLCLAAGSIASGGGGGGYNSGGDSLLAHVPGDSNARNDNDDYVKIISSPSSSSSLSQKQQQQQQQQQQKQQVVVKRDKDTSHTDTSRKSTTHIEHYIYTVTNPEYTQAILDDNESNNKEKEGQRKLPGNNLFIPNPWVNHAIVEHNAKFLPDKFQIHVYNNTSISRSVQLIDEELEREANVTGAWEAFTLIRPWAFRADLWRLMVVWSEGGVYLDGKMKLAAPVDTWASLFPNETAAFCQDALNSWHPTELKGKSTDILYNAVFAAKKRSPLLLDGIKRIIQNVQNRYYPNEQDDPRMLRKKPTRGALIITGPMMLGVIAAKHRKKTPYRHEMVFNYKKKGVFTYGDDSTKVLELDEGEHKKVKFLKEQDGTKKDYYALFRDRAIYCDDEGAKGDPDCDAENLLAW